MQADLTGRARVRAVVAGLAGLVGGHGPAGVLRVWGDGDQASVRGKLALPVAFGFVGVVGVPVRSGHHCHEGKHRGLENQHYVSLNRSAIEKRALLSTGHVNERMPNVDENR